MRGGLVAPGCGFCFVIMVGGVVGADGYGPVRVLYWWCDSLLRASPSFPFGSTYCSTKQRSGGGAGWIAVSVAQPRRRLTEESKC